MGSLVHLFDVDAVFVLESRGMVLAPGVATGGPELRGGEMVRIERPDGTCIEASVRAVETLGPGGAVRGRSFLPKDSAALR